MSRATHASDFYEWLAPIYDDLYDAIDVGETVRQWALLVKKLSLLPRARHPIPRLVDLGCGTGRYSVAWAASGFEVTGVDASRSMVTRARRRAKAIGDTAPVVICGDLRGDLRSLRVRAPFDVAVAHFNFLNLFTLAEVSVILASLAPAMASGGFLFADCAPPGLAADEDRDTLTLLNGDKLTITTRGPRRRGLVVRAYRYGSSTRTETYHLHSSRDVRRVARSAGWRVEHVVEWRPDHPRAPWSFARAASDRHRVYVLRTTGRVPSVD